MLVFHYRKYLFISPLQLARAVLKLHMKRCIYKSWCKVIDELEEMKKSVNDTISIGKRLFTMCRHGGLTQFDLKICVQILQTTAIYITCTARTAFTSADASIPLHEPPSVNTSSRKRFSSRIIGASPNKNVRSSVHESVDPEVQVLLLQ